MTEDPRMFDAGGSSVGFLIDGYQLVQFAPKPMNWFEAVSIILTSREDGPFDPTRAAGEAEARRVLGNHADHAIKRFIENKK